MTKSGSADVAGFLRERLDEGVSANTIRLDLASIAHVDTVARTALGHALSLNPVPLAKTARPRLPPGRDRRLQDGEEPRLIAAAGKGFGAIIRFALATAMRRSEIAGLTWDRVDLEQRAAHLQTTKNGAARNVPLSREALGTLKSIKRHPNGDDKDVSVFGLSENAISMAWKRVIHSRRHGDRLHQRASNAVDVVAVHAFEIAPPDPANGWCPAWPQAQAARRVARGCWD